MLGFTCEEITNSICVIDVTDQPPDLQVAFTMVAEGYAKLSSHSLPFQDVLAELCFDTYHDTHRTRTLLATGINPNTGNVEPIGTIRMVLGTDSKIDQGIPPLEVMSLITPTEGWDSFTFEDFNPTLTAEFGRFVVAPAYRGLEAKRKGYTFILCKSIFSKFVEVATQYDKNQFWALMPANVLGLLELINISAIPVPGLNFNSGSCSELFNKYDKYWQHSKPWFYKVTLENQRF
jgi:hypothetical protein